MKTLNILTEHEGRLVPTLAGMLMFGLFPQQFYPSLFVAFLMFAGTVLNDNQRFALAYLKRNPFAPKLTNRDYQRINSVDSVQATKELGDMVKRAGVLVQNGTRGGAFYTLSDWALEKNQQVEPLPELELSEDEREIINYVKTNGFITNSICRQLLKIDKNAASYLLTSMNRKHLLKTTGTGRWTKYIL